MSIFDIGYCYSIKKGQIMKEKIKNKLKQIEKDNDIKILFAIEKQYFPYFVSDSVIAFSSLLLY